MPLQPGDRLAFLTDGMSERNAAGAEIEALLARSATCTRARLSRC